MEGGRGLAGENQWEGEGARGPKINTLYGRIIGNEERKKGGREGEMKSEKRWFCPEMHGGMAGTFGPGFFK